MCFISSAGNMPARKGFWLLILKVRKQSKRTYSFEEVKRELALSNRVNQKTQRNQR